MMGFMGATADDRGAYSTLEQNLVGPSRDEVLPVSQATPMMEVIAPADLREGYEFEAEVGGQSFLVTVPPGGVEHGQKFMVPYGGEVVRPKTQVPVGAWKDGLCNCCKFGPCHNHLCMSCWCVPLAVGQVMTRLRLSWLGRPGSVNETTGSYQKILYFTIAYFSVWLLIRFLLAGNEPTDETDVSPIWVNLMILRDIMSYSFYFFSVYLLRNVRSHVREKYAIPQHESCPAGYEDCCISCWCPHLVAAQLLRHTADYDTYNSTCCTETGVASTAPPVA